MIYAPVPQSRPDPVVLPSLRSASDRLATSSYRLQWRARVWGDECARSRVTGYVDTGITYETVCEEIKGGQNLSVPALPAPGQTSIYRSRAERLRLIAHIDALLYRIGWVAQTVSVIALADRTLTPSAPQLVLLPARVPDRPASEPKPPTRSQKADRHYRVINSDVRDFASAYTGPKFHAVFPDSPYHLTSITKRFGGNNAAAAKPGKDGAFSRISKGFMGTTWDGGDIAFRPETWMAFSELMLPGAFGMSFAAARGWHRMACAIEDAGFIIHPSIFGWGFGSGWPTGAKQVEDAPDFEGYRYGVQSLKPALEPIIVFQKPYGRSARNSILDTGAGALWIDGARIPAADCDPQDMNPGGRWPANMVLIHHPTCNGKCHPDCAVRMLGEQSGVRPAGSPVKGTEPSATTKNVYYHYERVAGPAYNDTGTAARFFFNADWHYEVAEQIALGESLRYVFKPSVSEKDAGIDWYPDPDSDRLNIHPTVKPIALTEYLARLLLPPASYGPRRILVPFSGSGSEMIGAWLAGWEHIVGVEISAVYSRIARARLEHYTNQSQQIKLFV